MLYPTFQQIQCLTMQKLKMFVIPRFAVTKTFLKLQNQKNSIKPPSLNLPEI